MTTKLILQYRSRVGENVRNLRCHPSHDVAARCDQDCKLPAMAGDQLRLVSEQSARGCRSILYTFRGFAGLESFYDYFRVRANAYGTFAWRTSNRFKPHRF